MARARVVARYLAHELGEHGLAEGRVILHHLHEGAGAADHVLLVITIEGVVVAEYRQPVDDDALRHYLVARVVDGATLVVHAVAGDVDDLATGGDTAPSEERRREIERGADRGPIGIDPRRL